MAPIDGEPGPGDVELAVALELAGLSAAVDQPALAAAAVAMGRLLDSRAQSAKPSAARVLAPLLDDLHKASARDRRGGLSVVKAMTDPGGA